MDLCLLVPVLIVAVGEVVWVVEEVLVLERQRDHVPASFEVLVDGFLIGLSSIGVFFFSLVFILTNVHLIHFNSDPDFGSVFSCVFT